MGISFFYIDEQTFPIISFSRRPESPSYWENAPRARFSTEMYLKLATANDQNLLLAWAWEGAVKSGRIEFRNYEYDGSLQTLKFVNGTCSAVSIANNPDSVMLPVIVSLSILSEKLIYGVDYVVTKR